MTHTHTPHLRVLAGIFATTSASLLPLPAMAQTPPPPAQPELQKHMPQQIVSSQTGPNAGVLNGNLSAVFGTVSIRGQNVLVPVGPNTTTQQWDQGTMTGRLYATPAKSPPAKSPPWKPSLPGPTFVFRQGELLKLNFQNQLNTVNNPALVNFENNPNTAFGASNVDDTREHAAHEISIPNDSDITNLHVHGLHVDPKQDNVTLLILPQDRSPGTMDVGLQRFVPNINQWWTRNYQYKIPQDHIPGTYWYHAHKHGSTSSQIENGMAGVLVMRPTIDTDDYVTGLWNDDPGKTHDRVMIIQEITNIAQPLPPSTSTGTSTTPAQGSGQGKSKGKGKGKGRAKAALAGGATTYVTLNGLSQPQLTLPPGQGERWRFILAGANHTAAGSIWVGNYELPARNTLDPKLVSELVAITQANPNGPLNPANGGGPGPALFNSAVTYYAKAMPGIVLLASIDGIPMWNAQPLTPSTPTLGGAGNRFDLLVQPGATASGAYQVYFNYPFPSLPELASAYPDLFAVGGVNNNTAADIQARYTAYSAGVAKSAVANTTTTTNAMIPRDISSAPAPGLPIAQNLPQDFYNLGTNYTGFQPNWGVVDSTGANVAANTFTTPYSVIPLLSAQPSGKGVSINQKILTAYNKAGTVLDSNPALRYQPMPDLAGGLAPTSQVLMTLNVQGAPLPTPTFSNVANLQATISQYSPAGDPKTTKLQRMTKAGGMQTGIPAYVSPPGAVDGSQVAVFDRGQLSFDYTDKVTGQVDSFRQFTITGRQFGIDDGIGNPQSNEIIQAFATSPDPSLGIYNPIGSTLVPPNAPWTHYFKSASSPSGILFANPGYHRPIINYAPAGAAPLYNYDYGYTPKSSTPALPTYQNIVGQSMPNPTPPKSRTLEEWLLINNSDLYHPFHVHINPFFVEEIGQLNYSSAKGWNMNSITWNGPQKPPVQQGSASPFSWVVGNWWDVIMLPPHGYVRMKMWINVPDQTPKSLENPDELVVHDNANTYGSWVFHCHILRHEDRGMMSMVNTVPKGVSLAGKWNGGSIVITDKHGSGSLIVKQANQTSVAASGTFNSGIGNPNLAQPYAGSFNFAPTSTVPSTQPGSATFCYGESSGLIALSTGQGWVKNAKSGSYTVPLIPVATPGLVTLQGTWVDDSPEKNTLTIGQTGGAAGTGANTPHAANGKPAQLKLTPASTKTHWWAGGTGIWNAGAVSAANPNLNFAGQITLTQGTRSQLLSFAVTQTANGGPLKIVLSDGSTWTWTGK